MPYGDLSLVGIFCTHIHCTRFTQLYTLGTHQDKNVHMWERIWLPWIKFLALLRFVTSCYVIMDTAIVLTGGNWQKWKRVFLTCPCHEIYRDEAVGLKSCKNTWKITIFVKMWNLGAISWKFDILSITA